MTREELEKKKETILRFISSKEYRPLSIKEMGMVLQVPAKEKKAYRAVVDELIADGKIHVDLKGKVKPMADNLMTGTFMATQKGFGFVRVEGQEEDIFVPAHSTKGAIDGDTVRIAVSQSRGGRSGKRQEAEVVAIVERGTDILVGTYSAGKSFGFVVADNHKFPKDIYIAKSDTKGAITGHKVVVEITDFGTEDRNPEGRVLEILGHINDPGVDILSVIKAYGLPEAYPGDVMTQVENIEDEVAPSEKMGRTDYRSLQTVTIDGEDAKDLDDAITLTREGDLYQLGVHIADVSQYVTEHSPLDREALKRGTSVYLVDRVIPMLPHKLSNGICSLNQGTDRLALSCIMDINGKGDVVRHRIEETVIRVDRRMSYTSVHKIVEEQDEEERKEYEEFVPMFELMYELAEILRKRRFRHGSIDFEFPESKITLDDRGKPLNVEIYERNNAHRIIEEFMLIANQTVAEEYFWQELPFVYRTHEMPDSEKILALNEFVTHFGYSIKTGADDEIHPKEVQKLLKSVEGTPEEDVISRLALRSMKQAKYTTGCEGHFGLAFKYYCHFTSPIRRYPDLQIHRIIKENLRGGLDENRREHYHRILPEVAAESSRLERRAEEAEREVEKMKKAEYMEQFVGECFDGVISSVTSWGMYVELPNTIEGMIRVADIPGDYYYFDEESYQMVGEHTHKTYKLGQKIRVRVEAVDKVLRMIDFAPVEEGDALVEEGDADWQKATVQAKPSEMNEAEVKKAKEKKRKPKKLTAEGKPFSKKEKRKEKLQRKKKAEALEPKEVKQQEERKPGKAAGQPAEEGATKPAKQPVEGRNVDTIVLPRAKEQMVKKIEQPDARKKPEKATARPRARKQAKRVAALSEVKKRAAREKIKKQAKKKALRKAFAKKNGAGIKLVSSKGSRMQKEQKAKKAKTAVKKHGRNPQRNTRSSLRTKGKKGGA